MVEAPFEERLAARYPNASVEALHRVYRQSLRTAAATAQGLVMPMGFEFGARRRMDREGGSAEEFARDRIDGFDAQR